MPNQHVPLPDTANPVSLNPPKSPSPAARPFLPPLTKLPHSSSWGTKPSPATATGGPWGLGLGHRH